MLPHSDVPGALSLSCDGVFTMFLYFLFIKQPLSKSLVGVTLFFQRELTVGSLPLDSGIKNQYAFLHAKSRKSKVLISHTRHYLLITAALRRVGAEKRPKTQHRRSAKRTSTFQPFQTLDRRWSSEMRGHTSPLAL